MNRRLFGFHWPLLPTCFLLIAFWLLAANCAFGGSASDYFKSGVARQRQGDTNGALADYSTAIKLKPDYVAAYNNRGNLRKDSGDLDGAQADHTKAIELDPDYLDAYMNRGFVRRDSGRSNKTRSANSRRQRTQP